MVPGSEPAVAGAAFAAVGSGLRAGAELDALAIVASPFVRSDASDCDRQDPAAVTSRSTLIALGFARCRLTRTPYYGFAYQRDAQK
jgi:hypothetical protein